MAVACETMYGPVEKSIAPDSAGSIAITVDKVGDNDVTFTLTPSAECSYYSYLVEVGDKKRAVEPASVYNGAYAGDAVKVGTVKWTKDKPSQTITIEKLPNSTQFQIYAVVGSPMGVVGEVVNTSFSTSDTVAPVLAEEYESADSVLTITFSEPVKKGTGDLTVGVYAMNSAEITAGQSIATLTVDIPSVKIEENVVTVTVKGLPKGAFYALNYPEGAFEDMAGNKAAALNSSVTFGQETEWEPVYVGVGGRNTLTTWGFEDLPKGIMDPNAAIALVPNSQYGLGYIYEDPFTLQFVEPGKTTSYKLDYEVGYGLTPTGGIVFALPEAPAPGTIIQLTVPAEAFEDYYGNMNEEWEGVSQMAYDMSLPFEDVCGTFVLTHRSAFTGQYTQGLAILEKSDDPFKGNVMFTAFDSYKCDANIYGAYDPITKTLTFNSLQPFKIVTIDSQGTKGMLMFASGLVQGSSPKVGTDPVVFYLDENNLIDRVNYYYAVVIADLTGKPLDFYDFYTTCVATPYVPESASLQEKPNLNFYPLESKVLY